MRLERCGVTVLRSLASLAFIAGCDWMPGRPTEAERPVRPSQVTSFDVLYGQHCAGCHGANGNLGPALALKDPLYQALVTEEGLRKVIAQGVPGTMMPVFARKSGGVLTDRQINILAHEMKARWGRPREFANVKVPPYSLQEAMAEGSDRGDPQRGARVYAKYCARCHGKNGTGGPKGGSIVDDSYLALVSDQALRTVAITGRRDLGKPDWRDNTPGPPMTTQEINDVVAWLVSHRQVFPGRPYAGR